ncbi:hypothetical protein ACSHT0_06005 [Tepidicaulis sp. LMO-SS28]|uniref:hypothetical protein n=1 Tax=Tepidicaulis sp. LMO-SS28 TaxID=3447455 RepID=UPI003EDFCD46
MNLSLSFAPLIPALWFGVLTALSLALAAFFSLRRMRVAVWRFFAMALLLLLIANPSIRNEERDPVPDIGLIVVDTSASMKLEEREEAARTAAETLRERMGRLEALDIRTIYAGTPGGRDGTQLFADIDAALADIPMDRLAGLVLLTDGQVHDVPENLSALGIDAPVHSIILGNPKAYDRRLVIEEAPRFGIVDEELTITFRIEETGPAPDDAPRTVTLRLDGETRATARALPGQQGAVTVTLPHGGPNVIELEVEGAPEELTHQNNRAVTVPTGIRDRLRVLLVSGEPHAGERTWRNLLKADPAVDLVHFTILRPPEKQDGTPINELSLIAFPTRELFALKLDEFDLVIFDRYRRRGVLPLVYFDNIARYVEEGGALLAAAGPPFAGPFSLYRTPLANILPAEPTGEVEEEGFRPELTGEGRRHPVTAALPGAEGDSPNWGRWFRLIGTRPDQGQTLMQGASAKPLLVLDRVGEGRVAQLMSDQGWLWARGFEGGGPQAELLRRVAHWLMKEPDLEEERLSARGEADSLTIERRTMADTAAPAEVISPSGAREEVTLNKAKPGLFTATIEADELGLYRIEQDGMTALAAIGPANPKEYAEVVASDENIRPLTEASGGGVYNVVLPGNDPPAVRRVRAGRDAHGADWIGLRDNEAYILRGVREVPLLAGILAITAMLALLLFAWWRESR